VDAHNYEHFDRQQAQLSELAYAPFHTRLEVRRRDGEEFQSRAGAERAASCPRVRAGRADLGRAGARGAWALNEAASVGILLERQYIQTNLCRKRLIVIAFSA
jgi:hypothetical protein